MTNPLVSIVLPTYNGARYLAASIRSCLEQTYPHWELILVDDCSTDDTPAVIARFQALDARIRTIRHETNRQLPGALNTGFAAAKGDYLTWTSDDNAYRPHAIATMLGYLRAHPAIGVVYCDFTKTDAAGTPVQRYVVAEPPELAMQNCVGPCFLYPRWLAERVGEYNEDLFLAEDYEFWLRASQAAPMQPLHEDLYLYRLHDNTLTHLQKAPVRLAVRDAQQAQLPKMDWLPDAVRARALLRLAGAYPFFPAPTLKIRCLTGAWAISPLTVLRAGGASVMALIRRGPRWVARRLLAALRRATAPSMPSAR